MTIISKSAIISVHISIAFCRYWRDAKNFILKFNADKVSGKDNDMFGIGKAKDKGPVELKLEKDQFCNVLEKKADSVKNTFCVIASADNYNLLYRDGQFLGMPRPFGGAIYPFAVNPKEQGSNGEKNSFHMAKVVCLSKDFNLKVFWGTEDPFTIEDPQSGLAYAIGAHGVFYVNIDPTDAARKADMFYSKCLVQGNANLFNTEELRDFLKHIFVNEIGAKIEEFIRSDSRSLANYVGLAPSEILAISKLLCPRMKDIFAEFGLTIVESASSSSILQGLAVKEIG